MTMTISQKETFLQVALNSCPLCGERVALAMYVESSTPGEPDNEFWGPSGYRRQQCSEGSWFHFVVDDGGQEVHRLAFLGKKATPQPPTKKGRAVIEQTPARTTRK